MVKSRAQGQRSNKIDGLTEEAKEAARAAGLGDNQSALLKVASYGDADQVGAVEKIVADRAVAKSAPAENARAPEVKTNVLSAAWAAASQEERNRFVAGLLLPEPAEVLAVFEDADSNWLTGCFALIRRSKEHPGFYDYLVVTPAIGGGSDIGMSKRPITRDALPMFLRTASDGRLTEDKWRHSQEPYAAFDIMLSEAA